MAAEVAEANLLNRKLWHIAGTGDLEQLEKLLNQGADVNAGDRTGVTALMRAAYHGQLTMVRALIEKRADPNAKDRSGLTALTMAKHAGHQEIVEALLSSGAQARKEGESRPRRVVNVIDESISPAIKHEAPPEKTSEVRTLHEPPDTTSRGTLKEPPDTTSRVRTLQEPPDIWDMVHTTQPETDSPPIAYSPSKTLGKSLSTILPGNFISMRALAIGAGAAIICVAVVFGLVSLRGGSATGEASDQRVEASALRPISTTNQRTSTAKTLNDDRKSNPLMKVTPEGNLWGERGDQLINPAVASAILPVKKPAARQRTNDIQSVSKQNKNVRKSVSPESDQGANVKSAKSEQTPPVSDPIKPSVTQKPKVIQWP